MKYLSPVVAGTSMGFTVEFTRNQVDFVPTAVSYTVCRFLDKDGSSVIIADNVSVEDVANIIEINLPSELLQWDEKYTPTIVVVIKYWDENNRVYLEQISFPLTRVVTS